MNLKTILNAKFCGDIYTNDKNIAKKEYREFSKMYHPDVCNNKDAFIIVSKLYEEAKIHFENSTWSQDGKITISTNCGRKITLSPSYKVDFELGIIYYTRKKIFYIFNSDKEKYFNNFKNHILNISYENNDMKNEFERYFPKNIITYVLTTGEFCVIIDKTEDVLPIKQILEVENEIKIEHLAWIISRLLNISCFLKANNIVNNGISLNNCCISTEFHTSMLFNWWYTTKENEKMIGVEKRIYDIIDVKTRTDKISSSVTDIESIKLLARNIKTDRIIKEITDWFWSGSGENTFKEFEIWNNVLEKSFGKKRFVKWDLDYHKYYIK